MSESSTPSPQKSLSAAIRVAWAVLILATLYVCYFSHLGAIGFVGPDEPRYAWIARAMAETGDWVTPRLYGQPWFEKPPLFYWGAAMTFKIFGVSEAAARLPSAISALLATLALAWLALRMYGAETARWLLLLLPTTVGMIGFSHAAATDMPFSGMLTIAMVCAAVALRIIPASLSETARITSSRAPEWLALILFGFFLGLAVLAKGPAGIILCGGAVFFWAIFTKRWRDAFRLLHPAAIVAFCITALPWYVLCARRNPDFFRVFIIEHNFKRFLTPEFQHIQPFWYYIIVVLVAVLPWTGVFLWSSALATMRMFRERHISAVSTFLACWALFCLVFFSISKSKLPGYILPAIPAICLAMAYCYAMHRRAHEFWFRIVQLLAALAFLVLALLLVMFGRHSLQPSGVAATAASLIAGGLCLTNLAAGVLSLARTQDSLHSLAAGFSVIPIIFLLSMTSKLLPSFFFFDPSGKSIAHELKAREIPADQLYVQAMRRGQQYSLDFYVHAETKTWNRDKPVEGYLLTGARVCEELVPPSWSCDEIPFDLQATGRFLFRVRQTSSVPRPASSR